MPERDVGKIKKNDTSDIILRVDNFGGRKGLTIREFVTSDRYTGFTKAGVKIMAADFPKFKEMINSVTTDDMKAEEPDETPAPAENKPKAQKTLPKAKEELPDY